MNFVNCPRTWSNFKRVSHLNLSGILVIKHKNYGGETISMYISPWSFQGELNFSWLGNYILAVDVLAEPVLFDTTSLPCLDLKPVFVQIVVNLYWLSPCSKEMDYTEHFWDLNCCYLSLAINCVVRLFQTYALVSAHSKKGFLLNILTRVVGTVKKNVKVKMIMKCSCQIDGKNCIRWSLPWNYGNMTCLVSVKIWWSYQRPDLSTGIPWSYLPVGCNVCELYFHISLTWELAIQGGNP